MGSIESIVTMVRVDSMDSMHSIGTMVTVEWMDGCLISNYFLGTIYPYSNFQQAQQLKIY